MERILCFVMVLFQFGFLARPIKNPHPDPNRKEAINAVKEFPLTMTPSEVVAKAEALGLTIIDPYDDPDYSSWEENPVRDGRSTDSYGNFWYDYEEGIHFSFNEGEEFYGMNVKGDLFETPEGIRVGDSKRSVLKAYGLFGFSIFPVVHRLTRYGHYMFLFDPLQKNKSLNFWQFSKEHPVHND